MTTAQAPREYRDLVEQAKAAGWVLEPRRKHLQLRSPKDDVVVIPKTSSDHRGPIKARADLQRAGLVLRQRRGAEPPETRSSDAKPPSELEVIEALSFLGRATPNEIALRLGLHDDPGAIERTRVRLRRLVSRGVARHAGVQQSGSGRKGAPRILYAVASEPMHTDEKRPEDGTEPTANAEPTAEPYQPHPTVVAAATDLLRNGLPRRSIPAPAWRALGEACLALATFCEEMAK